MSNAIRTARLFTATFRLSVCFVLLLVPVFFVRAQVQERPRMEVLFPMSETIVLKGFDGNSESLSSLDSLLRSVAPGDIRVLVITSAASPEGPTFGNHQLSLQRGEALRDYILARRPDLAPVIEVRSTGEAWEDLRELDNSVSGKMDDAALRALPGFRQMVNEYLPRLRYARIDWAPRLYAISSWDTEDYLSAAPFGIAGAPVAAAPVQAPSSCRAVFGVSTNIPYDITYVPNYGLTSIPSFSLEYYPRRGKYTVGADLEIPMWKHPAPEHRYLQIQNLTLWVRRYFKPVQDRFKGAYLLASANAARYGIGWDSKGWEGEGLGASLGAGYKLFLGKRLFLDMGGAIGFFYSAYDPFVWGNDATGRYYYDYAGDPNQFTRRRKRLFWAGPTRVFISLGFDLFKRK